MKSILLTLTLLILGLLPIQATKRPDVHPINIAAIIVEKIDSTKVASILDYYGYSLQGTENGYQIMKDDKGNEIRYSFTEITSTNKYPTVIVKTPRTDRSIDSILTDINFDKTGNSYERLKNSYSDFKTKCNLGSHNTLIFRRVKN